MNLGLHCPWVCAALGFALSLKPIPAHSRESGNPGAENSAKELSPASAVTSGMRGDSNSAHLALPPRYLQRRLPNIGLDLSGGLFGAAGAGADEIVPARFARQDEI